MRCRLRMQLGGGRGSKGQGESGDCSGDMTDRHGTLLVCTAINH